MDHIKSYTEFLLLIIFPYALIAGGLWLLWYKWLRCRIIYKKIQQRFPKNNDYRREIGYSLVTMLVFAAAHSLMLLTSVRNFTQFYTDTSQHSMVYFWLAFPLMFLIHDTWFYWSHRLMHHRRLFRFFHLVHHKSTNPSPWAAFAFHPLEAMMEAGVFPLLLFSIPLTSYHLYFFYGFMMMYSIYEHLGWELYPKGFSKHYTGRWIGTSATHNHHHQHFSGNYGLYFLFWDRIMGTLLTESGKKQDGAIFKNKTVETQHLILRRELVS